MRPVPCAPSCPRRSQALPRRGAGAGCGMRLPTCSHLGTGAREEEEPSVRECVCVRVCVASSSSLALASRLKTRASCQEVRPGSVPGASSTLRPVHFGAWVCIRNFVLGPNVTAALDRWACARAVPGAASRPLIVPRVDE